MRSPVAPKHNAFRTFAFLQLTNTAHLHCTRAARLLSITPETLRVATARTQRSHVSMRVIESNALLTTRHDVFSSEQLDNAHTPSTEIAQRRRNPGRSHRWLDRSSGNANGIAQRSLYTIRACNILKSAVETSERNAFQRGDTRRVRLCWTQNIGDAAPTRFRRDSRTDNARTICELLLRTSCTSCVLLCLPFTCTEKHCLNFRGHVNVIFL